MTTPSFREYEQIHWSYEDAEGDEYENKVNGRETEFAKSFLK